MNQNQQETFKRIAEHRLDFEGDTLTFSKRLARENGWSARYTERVIEEYRRFCFLAVHAGHPVTPSDAVDQAWHLHLTYTRDYWETYCPDVLGIELHHGPTRGGKDEAAKYTDWYARTLSSYFEFFGRPPRDLWPEPAERFRNVARFVRINTADELTLSRTAVRRGGLALGGIGLTVTAASAMASDASDIVGGLVFVAIVIIAGTVLFTFARNSASGGSGRQGGCGYVGAPMMGSSGKKKATADSDAAGGDGGGDAGGGSGDGGGGCGGA